MEIRRFGVGHRRPDGPPGARGVEGQQIHVDPRGLIAEMALRPHAVIPPHTNPNLTYFVVVEGGGFVRVGDETARVSAGEAVVWPPDVVHAAWTELTPMRAIVVEFASGAAGPTLLLEGAESRTTEPTTEPAAGSANGPPSAGGGLAPKPTAIPAERESPDKEPW
jgi:quercetin dioxygenase-like cupin family protein